MNPDLETEAQELTTAISPNQPSQVNPFASQFDGVIVEPRLTSSTMWFLAAQFNQVDTIEYGYLRGRSGPTVEKASRGNTDGVEYKVLHDFGAGPVDYRGLYRGNV